LPAAVLVVVQAGLLAGRGVDVLDAYASRYLPQRVVAVVVPVAVGLRILTADWLSALLLAVTVTLVPVFMVLIGLLTRQRVLDEPTAHLDAATAERVLAELLCTTAGRTVIVTSHRPEGFPGLPRLRLPAAEPQARDDRRGDSAAVLSAVDESRRAAP
jgi:ABC-type transport system involved in cytochrome bd biosynthesis fused ATPase/permease subunit